MSGHGIDRLGFARVIAPWRARRADASRASSRCARTKAASTRSSRRSRTVSVPSRCRCGGAEVTGNPERVSTRRNRRREWRRRRARSSGRETTGAPQTYRRRRHRRRFALSSSTPSTAQKAREDLRIGKRMTPVRSGLGAGEILLDGGKERARHVRLIVEPAPQPKIG